MRHRKHRLGLISLFAVTVLAVMTLASTAQAVTPEFLINKKTVGALKATFGAEQVGTTAILIPALNFGINCQKLALQEGKIESSTDASAKLLFEECTALELTGAKGEISVCEVIVSQSLKDFKHHITTTALLLPAELKNGEPAILAEKISALVLFRKETGCPLFLNFSIIGELCLKLDSNFVKPAALASETIQGECKERSTLEALSEKAGVKDKLIYGPTYETFFDTTTRLFLEGEHKGLTLGVSSEKPPLQPATKLCNVQKGACEGYSLGSEISASLEEEVKFLFPYEGEELEPPCRVSTMSGKTTKEVAEEGGGEGGGSLLGEFTSLKFKECGGGLCTVTPQNLPYKFEVKATSEGNGTMTWSSGGGGPPAFAIKCLGFAKCVYGATSMTFTVTGGSPAKVSNSGVSLKREAGSDEACGELGAKWEGIVAAEGKVKYKITTPSPLFVRVI